MFEDDLFLSELLDFTLIQKLKIKCEARSELSQPLVMFIEHGCFFFLSPCSIKSHFSFSDNVGRSTSTTDRFRWVHQKLYRDMNPSNQISLFRENEPPVCDCSVKSLWFCVFFDLFLCVRCLGRVATWTPACWVSRHWRTSSAALSRFGAQSLRLNWWDTAPWCMTGLCIKCLKIYLFV